MMGLLIRLLGRRTAWRVGRKIYFEARGELPNDMKVNGESWLIAQAIAKLADDGEFHAWDVGGNVGEWTELLLEAAARSGVQVQVDLFEPAPGALAGLKQKFAANPVVRLHPIALSSRSGTAQFEVVGPSAGTNTLNRTHSPDAELIDVIVATGAQWHGESGKGHVHLIKIDAEGHDLEVLRGIETLLDAGQVDLVQFEYNWRWLLNGSSLRKLFDLIAGKEYAIGRLLPDQLELYDSWNPELDRFFEGNYVLVRNGIVPRLRHRTIGWCNGNLPVGRP